MSKTITIYPHPNRERCTVATLLKYHSRLRRKCNALYLWPKCDSKCEDSVWYYDIPVGIKLQTVVKDMCDEAGFQGHYSNHSLRSTSATRMYEAGIDEQTICEITGYRSNAVHAYKHTSEELKRKASETISYSNLQSASRNNHLTIVLRTHGRSLEKVWRTYNTLLANCSTWTVLKLLENLPKNVRSKE